MPLDRKTVERFHRVLLEEIRSGAPEYLEGPFTVAEIYQSLVPYRTHRDRIGVELNGDYEDALLRLLAGEGDLVRLDSDAARERIRREVASPNPNTGIYREFAAVGVRLNPDQVPSDEARNGDGEGAAAPEPALPLEESVPAHVEEPEVGGFEPAPASSTSPRGEEASSAARKHLPVAAPPGDSCPECGGGLPERDTLRFCPSCGVNVFVTPCGECGEVLERSWRFCVACGASSGV